ncbi:MAG: branched-chain amino acid aminotransferase [Chitinophagales bacterium]|jgi:branched-chain amino acid aminotransferase
MNYQIKVNKTTESRLAKEDFSDLGFGRIFSDHMFVADYDNGEWGDFRIIPFDYLPMHPAMSSIHYGQSIFEGLKARKNDKGEIIVFRPEKNVERLNKSAHRMAMPEVPEDLFFQALDQLLTLENEWIPGGEGKSLYIRPYLFATDEFIGIRRSSKYKFIIFTSPVASYYSEPVKVYASDEYVRAFPGGTGFAKTAGNYARAIQPVEEINKRGYQQILWLDGIHKKFIQEIGTMNFFVVIDGKVITPSLEERTILPGVTRDSVITLLKEWNIPVEERKISIDEVADAHNSGQLDDAFGAGTAATISQIKAIGYKDDEFTLPPFEERTISNRLLEALTAIKTGKIEDTHNWLRVIKPV